MAISGLQTINIGLPNESAGSDSLYTAFNKTKTNFATLFGNASPYNTFNGNTGISVTANSTTGIVDITNSGVTNIIAGTNITVNQSNGNVTISSTGGGGGGTVTSVGVTPVSNTRLAVTNSPVVSSGNITIDLVTTGVTAGTYTYPTVTVDSYGRIINASNASSVGTVTSVAVSPGTGIQVTGSPITTNGTVTITNTGVTRLTAGTGVSLSGSTGNVTISALQPGGTVTSVNVSSPNGSLSVSGGPVTTIGTITLDLSDNVDVAGNLKLSGSENLSSGSNINLEVTASYFSTTGSGQTANLRAGTSGQIKTLMMNSDGGGDMVVTVDNAAWGGSSTLTFANVGDACTLQYVNSKWFVIGNNGVVLA